MPKQVDLKKTNLTQLTGLAINSPGGVGIETGVYLPQVTAAEYAALPATRNGMMVYQDTGNVATSGPAIFTGQVVNKESVITTAGSFKPIGSVSGPAVTVANRAAIWADTTGQVLGQADADKPLEIPALSTSNIAAPTGAINVNSPLSLTSSATYTYNENANIQTLTSDGVAAKTVKKGTKAPVPYVLQAQGGIYAPEFCSTSNYQPSSEKIKNKLEVDDLIGEVEVIIERLKFHKFEYKDQVEYAAGEQYGVIAEELRKELPNLITDKLHYLPNIMQHGLCKQYKDSLYTVTLDTPVALLVADKQLRLLGNGEEYIVTIISCEADELLVKSNKELPTEVYVYGTEELLPIVDNNYLNRLSLIMVQELLYRVRKLEVKSEQD